MMPTAGAWPCDVYSALSGLNGVLGRLPRASVKAACRGFHLALGFHPSPLWGLRAHGPLGTFPCTRTRSPNTSAKRMWVMTRASARGKDRPHNPRAPAGGPPKKAARRTKTFVDVDEIAATSRKGGTRGNVGHQAKTIVRCCTLPAGASGFFWNLSETPPRLLWWSYSQGSSVTWRE